MNKGELVDRISQKANFSRFWFFRASRSQGKRRT